MVRAAQLGAVRQHRRLLMDTEGTRWFNALVQYASQQDTEDPLPPRASLNPAEEAQCQIIGGSLIDWIRREGPRLIAERAALAHLTHVEKDPFVVFTSTRPGLVAARKILHSSGRILSLHPDAFATWSRTSPDPEFKWHLHYWSYFEEDLPLDLIPKANLYRLDGHESHWLHREGTMCGVRFGRGSDHLWKWDGVTPVLLEEGFSEWLS